MMGIFFSDNFEGDSHPDFCFYNRINNEWYLVECKSESEVENHPGYKDETFSKYRIKLKEYNSISKSIKKWIIHLKTA